MYINVDDNMIRPFAVHQDSFLVIFLFVFL